MKPLHHQVLIVRITDTLEHKNADTLCIIPVLGYQVVAKKGQFKAGELAIYIQPDSVVPQTEPFRWLWEPYSREVVDNNISGNDIPHHYWEAVPARRRRITVKKLRKEWSEGLLMPLTDFPNLIGPEVCGRPMCIAGEGDDVSDLLGITHYNPEEDTPEGNTNAPVRKVRRPKTLKGWAKFFWYRLLHLVYIKRDAQSQAIAVAFDSPQYDVPSMKAMRSVFAEGELVVITEKLHGSSARYVVLDGVQYIGSHFQWKSPTSKNIFTRAFEQHPWIGKWCRANEGRILYGEVIGDHKGFTYGLDKAKGELAFYAFDIREPNGTWTKPWMIETVGGWSYSDGMKIVPLLHIGLFNRETAIELAETKKSEIDHKTTREGVVVSAVNPAPEGSHRPRQLKLVSNTYLEEAGK